MDQSMKNSSCSRQVPSLNTTCRILNTENNNTLETESKKMQDRNTVRQSEAGQIHPIPNSQQNCFPPLGDRNELQNGKQVSEEKTNGGKSEMVSSSHEVPAPEVCVTQEAEKATENKTKDQDDNEKKSEDLASSRPKVPQKDEEMKGENEPCMEEPADKKSESEMPKPPDISPNTGQKLEESKSKVKRVPVGKWRVRNCNEYVFSSMIGKGTFGSVYKAKLRNPTNEKEANEIVALKKLNMEKEEEGFPITALREISILRKLKHNNVVHLKEVVVDRPLQSKRQKGDVYLVFEYMQHDLHGLLDKKVDFSSSQIKCLMYQLLLGVNYLHEQNIMHRDIKGANLLLNDKGVLKLTDFGLARNTNPTHTNYTNRVVTLWYRAPELLLGTEDYTPSIDMWSVGCFFSEFLTNEPLFPGDIELRQLDIIFKKLGFPTEESWPGVSSIKTYPKLENKPNYKYCLKEYLSNYSEKADEHAVDLISKMLQLDPSKRITAADALKHPYFYSDPRPCLPGELPHLSGEYHEYTVRKDKSRAAHERKNSHTGKQAGSHTELAKARPKSKSHGGPHRGGFQKPMNQRPPEKANGEGQLAGVKRPHPAAPEKEQEPKKLRLESLFSSKVPTVTPGLLSLVSGAPNPEEKALKSNPIATRMEAFKKREVKEDQKKDGRGTEE